MVLLVPVTLSLCRSLQLDPVPFLLGEVFASNIGGAATLVGDPPNIIIGSAADIDFLSFVVNLTPVIILSMALLLGLLFLWFRDKVAVPESRRREIMNQSPSGTIHDRGLLVKSLIVLGLTIFGFLVHGLLDVSPSFIAIGGAAALLLISRIEPAVVLREVQWNTLFFFVGLFVVVGGLVENGVVDRLQEWLVEVTDGDQTTLALVLVWFSGLISGVVDNIPYTATMTPLVKELAAAEGGDEISPLWWALSLGANLGGNLTLVAASANVLVMDLARSSGHPISFLLFLRYGVVISLGTLGLATTYIWLRYLL